MQGFIPLLNSATALQKYSFRYQRCHLFLGASLLLTLIV